MKVAVIGTINKDLILPFEGASIQSFGGIFYTITALSILGGENIQIYPVSFIGEDILQPLNALLQKYQSISPDRLIPLQQKNHEVILEYNSPEERMEKALFNFPSLEWHQIKKINDVDFFLINMITGWDLSLKSFHKLSKKFFNKMYLDVHFLVMGVDNLGKRVPRCPDNIREWLRGARFVQMNQREFSIINNTATHEIAFFEENFREVQVLIITQGGRGAKVIFRKNNMTRDKHFPTFHLEKIIDTTGCGDVFGAGFVWKYLNSQNIYSSMKYACNAATANCMLKGTNEMDILLSQMDKFREL